MKRAIIIQARNGSTRFPKKMTADIDGKGTPVLAFILNRLIDSFNKQDIIIATTTNERDNVLEQITTSLGVKIFRGDEDNVLKRFINCAEKYNITEIIRLCADNPFLSIEDMKTLFMIPMNDNDYISFDINGNVSIKTHFGFWAELVSLKALKKIAELTEEKIYLEHVTNFIYSKRNIFKIELIQPIFDVCKYPMNIRLTLDTEEDFKHIKFVLKHIKDKDYSLSNIYNILQKTPFLLEKMTLEINKNTK